MTTEPVDAAKLATLRAALATLEDAETAWDNADSNASCDALGGVVYHARLAVILAAGAVARPLTALDYAIDCEA